MFLFIALPSRINPFPPLAVRPRSPLQEAQTQALENLFGNTRDMLSLREGVRSGRISEFEAQVLHEELLSEIPQNRLMAEIARSTEQIFFRFMERTAMSWADLAMKVGSSS